MRRIYKGSNDQFDDACDLETLLHPSQAFGVRASVRGRQGSRSDAQRKASDPGFVGIGFLCDGGSSGAAMPAGREAPRPLR
jgi:hypothetical protein